MSSAGFVGKRTNHSDDVMGTSQNEERLSQWGEIDGEVVSFDPVRQVATIRPIYKPKFNGTALDMPNLEQVPVRFPRVGKGALTYPVGPGDKVNLRPKMRSGENYLIDGDGTASDARSFNLSDMEAHLDGGESLNDPIQNFDSENVHIRANDDGSFGMKMSPDGKFKIDGAQGNVFQLLSEVVSLLAADQLIINYGSSAGTGHQLSNRAAYAEIADKLNAMAL